MGISNLQGTSWHIEQMHRKEGDDRRHRSRCMFYNPTTKQCKGRWKCNGSRYCQEYEPLSEEEFRQRQRDSAKAKKLLSNGYDLNEISIYQTRKKNKTPAKSLNVGPAKKSNVNSNEIDIKRLPDLQGRYIYHKGYGTGFVITQLGDNITVEYNGIIKDQRLSTLLKNNTIVIATNNREKTSLFQKRISFSNGVHECMIIN